MQEEKPAVVCPECGARYRVSVRFAGRTVACKRCGKPFSLDFSHRDGSADGAEADITEDASYLVLGRLAQRFGLIDQEQLDRAVTLQQQRRAAGETVRLGEVLVEAGLIDAKQRDFLVSVQQMKDLRSADRRFGDVAVKNGFLSEEQVRQALAVQKECFAKQHRMCRIGDLLVEDGVLTPEQRDTVLAAQDRLNDSEAPEPEPPLRVEIADDRLSARLLRSDTPFDDGVDVGFVQRLLSEAGVSAGVRPDDAIAAYLAGADDEPWVVAEGAPAKPGRDGSVEYFFDTDPHRIGRLKEGGVIDFKDHGTIPQVAQGEELARKTPPQPGIDGIDVLGNTLTAPAPADPPLRAGKGAALAPDGYTVTAGTGGSPAVNASGIVSVFPEYTVKGNVGYDTGHIAFEGMVKVSGSVESGFRVSGGGLSAQEVLEAEIDVGGDVVVTGGIIGGTVRAGGNLKALYLRGARVEVAGDVVVGKEITDSRVSTSGAVLAERCKVYSSRVAARQGMRLGEVGSEVADASELLVGMDEQMEAQRRALDAKLMSTRQELEQAQEAVTGNRDRHRALGERSGALAQAQDRAQEELREVHEQIEAQKAKGKDTEMLELRIDLLQHRAGDAARVLDEAMAEQDGLDRELEELRGRADGLAQTITLLEQELEALRSRDEEAPKLAEVTVTGTIHAGNRLKAPHKSLTLKQPASKVRFVERLRTSADGGRIWELVQEAAKKAPK